MKVDVKSFFIGIIVSGILFFGFQLTKENNIGRYQVSTSSIFPPILIDTKTGISYKISTTENSEGKLISIGWQLLEISK